MKKTILKTIPFLLLFSLFIYSCNKITSLPPDNDKIALENKLNPDDCLITFCTGNPGDLIHIYLGESCNSTTIWITDLTMDDSGCASYNFTQYLNLTHIVQMDRSDCPSGFNECSYFAPENFCDLTVQVQCEYQD